MASGYKPVGIGSSLYKGQKDELQRQLAKGLNSIRSGPVKATGHIKSEKKKGNSSFTSRPLTAGHRPPSPGMSKQSVEQIYSKKQKPIKPQSAKQKSRI